MTYERHIFSQISNHFKTRRQALILTGPRQVGKTKLLKHLFPHASYFNCDDEPTRKIFNSHAISTYKQYLKETGLVILDEVQNLNDPGRVGKLIIDQFPGIKLCITGSAGLTIKNRQAESMAGRAINYELLPLSLSEYLVQNQLSTDLNYNLFNYLVNQEAIVPQHSLLDVETILDRLLVYGLYPNLIDDPDPKQYLDNLTARIIFRDLLDLKLVESKNKALRLLTLLAHQIGQTVSMAELGNQSDLDQRTVSSYLTLFQESYLIYLLYPYSKRERDVLSKRPKIYFYDTGVRNSLIGNYQNLNLRTDKGALLENFYIMEAVKAIKYQNLDANLYYWRTKQGSEIDLVIDYNEQIYGVEFKWNRGAISSAFRNRYPNAINKIVNQFAITCLDKTKT